MKVRVLPLLLPGVWLVSGCFERDTTAQLVPDRPFGAPAAIPAPTRTSYTPAATETAARVDQVGRAILAANPQVGIRPLFRTIGTPQPELFHHGTAELNITEGLVKQCATDAQLTALLCVELGKMMSEREALASPRKRADERELSLDVPIHGDSGADQTRLAELARHEQDRRRRTNEEGLPPDPQALARTYLTRMNVAVTELDAVAPLLKAAGANTTLEKQLAAPGPARPWTR